MTTNIHYLIAGMAVLLVVIWQYSRQRQMDDRNSRMFRRLLSVVSLDVAAELVRTGFILYAPYSFNVCRMLSNTVFYLFQALLPLLLLYYVCTLCTSRVIAPSAVLRMGIPTIALVCIILTNPFTEMLFYFDGTGYRHGPWYLLQRPAAHRGGGGLCRGAPRVGQPPQSRVALRGLCARRPRHRRAGRQP